MDIRELAFTYHNTAAGAFETGNETAQKDAARQFASIRRAMSKLSFHSQSRKWAEKHGQDHPEYTSDMLTKLAEDEFAAPALFRSLNR